MKVSDEQIRDLISQRAADWFIANRAGLTPHERQSFTDWLKTSPVHVEEYLAVTAIGRDMRQACAASEHSIDALVARARSEADSTLTSLEPWVGSQAEKDRSTGWQLAALALSASALIVGSLVMLRNYESTPLAQTLPETVAAVHYQTGHGEQKTYVLTDHSVVHLNTDSDLEVRFSKTQRAASLLSGEATFEVEHDHTRPFRVTAKSADIIDVGTRFNVRISAATTVITVMEGRVEVLPANGATGSPDLQVPAGTQISVTDGILPVAPTSTDTARATAWLHRQIYFDREPLEHVAAELNRYASKSIMITTPALRSLEVSGIFKTDDAVAFIAFLRSLDDVRVEETATQILVSSESHRKASR